MTRYALCFYGNPILRTRCRPVDEIDDEVRELIAEMIRIMKEHRGIGIAAPQVGADLRIFVTDIDGFDEDGRTLHAEEPKVYINPKLSDPSKESDVTDEYCLSIPSVGVPVERPTAITIEAMSPDGTLFTERLEGFLARVRMHENDHINGTLIIDRTTKKARNMADPKLREIKKLYNQ